MALAIYRRYRPRTLSDLEGQEVNVEVFKNGARADRLGHAYLFYGSRGTGKTTTARLLAKLFNCQKRQENKAFHDKGEPCNECTACEQIDNNTALDVIEIDAASNRGIDEIRNLKESISSAPASLKYKVFIIDEAHMLTGAAFNALLKTLEEPPAHGVIILATTEYDKLPATITSRTQRFLFKKLPKTVIQKKLAAIAKQEKIDIDAAALEVIAAAAEGSMRDAESLLDQAASIEGHIDAPAVERLTGRVGLQKVEALAGHIVARDLKASLAAIAALQEQGDNIVQVTKDLIHYLRKIASLQADASLEATIAGELTADELARLKKIAAAGKLEATIAALKALILAYSQMRYSPLATVPLQIALTETLRG